MSIAVYCCCACDSVAAPLKVPARSSIGERRVIQVKEAIINISRLSNPAKLSGVDEFARDELKRLTQLVEEWSLGSVLHSSRTPALRKSSRHSCRRAPRGRRVSEGTMPRRWRPPGGSG